jgi:Fe-S-cluster containining protein
MMDNFSEAVSCGAHFLKQKKDGSCWYLKSNICSIHAIRPQACRNFFCTSKAKKFKTMIEEINKIQVNCDTLIQ